MTAARVARPDLEVGCVLAREIGVVVVLTDDGPVRASYGDRMLGVIAGDRSRVPSVGEWVRLRRWSDGPVTIEGTLGLSTVAPLAQVLPLRGARPTGGAERRLDN